MNLDGITRPNKQQVKLENPRNHSPLVLQNRVVGELRDKKTGKCKSRMIHEGNICCTYGLNRLSEMLISDADGLSNWISGAAIGSDTTAENSTQGSMSFPVHAFVHLSQASMEGSDKGDFTSEWRMTFDDSSAYEVHEIGLFCTNAATGFMAARSVLGANSFDKGTGDTLYMSYQIIASIV